ncbi:IS110 family transposase [Nonomuraea sp. CA-143628]|uniref:IS110 family transposase n=1 Tax=Nonomuraea sp. CA-143628 TaxID=3239997 RepID=UPI003D8FC72B
MAKASGKVCTRLPHESGSGRRVTRVWDVEARTNAIIELADHLACQQVELITVESTSDYWRIFFYLLEARGLTVQLVNARDAKNVPGRPKTDNLDAVWLAKLTERGMLRPSFVPPPEIRRLRDYTRLRIDGERYRRIVKRRGKLRALVAVARSVLVIIWHLLNDPATRFHDLGSGYHSQRIDKGTKTRNHIRQLEALGFTVTLTPTA